MNAPALLVCAALAAHPLTVRDLMVLDRVSRPRVSPRERVVFTSGATES